MRIGIVVPHIFMHQEILPKVIFSPGHCALSLCEGLQELGADVTLFSPGTVNTSVKNITANLSLFEDELAGRGDSYLALLKKHPTTFVTLARQVQAELLAKAFKMANDDEFDILHIYTNEEELGLAFAGLCNKPVVFTHHDPFNFLVKYKSIFPKYSKLPFISLSFSQRLSMPTDTNWLANVYHGLDKDQFAPIASPTDEYFAFVGRIIEPKGVHLAIDAINIYNTQNNTNYKLRIAGKHYSGHAKNDYWHNVVLPKVDGNNIIYEGFLNSAEAKNKFIGNAKALLVPSLFDEPFGMVSIEALACGTPVIGLDSGAIPEIINNPKIGKVVKKVFGTDDKIDGVETAKKIALALNDTGEFDRKTCREVFEQNYTTKRMCQDHLEAYKKLLA